MDVDQAAAMVEEIEGGDDAVAADGDALPQRQVGLQRLGARVQAEDQRGVLLRCRDVRPPISRRTPEVK